MKSEEGKIYERERRIIREGKDSEAKVEYLMEHEGGKWKKVERREKS